MSDPASERDEQSVNRPAQQWSADEDRKAWIVAMLSEVGAVREADPGRVRIVRVVLDEAVRADHEEGAKIVQALPHRRQRSEEHTSELQSLMRISYAVFCLKKQTEYMLKSTNHETHD